MATLLLQFVAAQQSWGTRSRFDQRDTGQEPSKSGVIGLLACALGRSREEPVADLTALKLGVRIDREGVIARDLHTAQDVLKADESGRMETAFTQRYYLADAAFLVGLESDDRALLERLHHAVLAPRWPLFLGRRAFVPGLPLATPDAIVAQPLLPALRNAAVLVQGAPRERLIVLESALRTPHQRYDQPIGNFRDRRFAPRFVELRLEVFDAPVATAT